MVIAIRRVSKRKIGTAFEAKRKIWIVRAMCSVRWRRRLVPKYDAGAGALLESARGNYARIAGRKLQIDSIFPDEATGATSRDFA